MIIDCKLSIVVPCYNCEKTLKRCLEPLIRAENMGNVEIVLVDDGSTDKTANLCDEYEAHFKCITTVHQDNGGLVHAWKTGVRNSKGQYIGFCDSDDYVDDVFLTKAIDVIEHNNVDVIAFGTIMDYGDNVVEYHSNKLENGLYSGQLLQEIKKCLLFSGKMQSEKLLNSRWAKLFRATVLNQCMDYINDDLTYGEDGVTTYATVLKANSLLCINNWFPYHYLRTSQSMIGAYDSKWYAKILTLRKGLTDVANAYSIKDMYQIDNYVFSWILMYAKKEIGRNPQGYFNVRENLKRVRNDVELESIIPQISISKYKTASKVFALLFINKKYSLLYFLVKLISKFGIGKF